MEAPLQPRVEMVKESGLLAFPHILRVHDANYVMKLAHACARAVGAASAAEA